MGAPILKTPTDDVVVLPYLKLCCPLAALERAAGPQDKVSVRRINCRRHTEVENILV